MQVEIATSLALADQQKQERKAESDTLTDEIKQLKLQLEAQQEHCQAVSEAKVRENKTSGTLGPRTPKAITPTFQLSSPT